VLELPHLNSTSPAGTRVTAVHAAHANIHSGLCWPAKASHSAHPQYMYTGTSAYRTAPCRAKTFFQM
jgi:hypothetical protein